MRVLATILLCLAACLPTGCKKGRRSGGPTSQGEDGEYSRGQVVAGAWETAEKLAKAWKAKNYEAAKSIFSPELIDAYDERDLRPSIEGLPNHEHKSAEVTSPRRVGEGRMEFTLEFEILARGEMGDRVLRKTWRVVLVRYNKKWLVDKIPLPKSPLPG